MRAVASDAQVPPVELPTERTDPFDPPALLNLLQGQGEICRLHYPDGDLGWLVLSHAASRAVLADPRFSMVPQKSPVGDVSSTAAVCDPVERWPEGAGILIEQDPPQHTRLRRLQAGFFTVRGVREHRTEIERIVRERIDAMEQSGPPADLVEMFALPVASMTICAVLGVPAADRGRFERPSDVNQDPAASAEEKIAAFDDFLTYVYGVIRTKRAHPGDDVAESSRRAPRAERS